MIGYYPISNILSIIIIDIDYSIDDWIKYRYSNEKRVYRSKIRYEDDNPYFKTCLGKIFLNECLRC